MTTVVSRAMPFEPRSAANCSPFDVVAHDGVVEIGVPVDLHGTGNVAGLVEQHVFVGLDDDEAGFTEVLGEPLGGDETLGMGVLGELRCGVELGGHGTSWERPVGRGVRGSGLG